MSARLTTHLTYCRTCRRTTSRAYARKHDGNCKACAEPNAPHSNRPTREERILDAGWQAYAREEGHYDDGGDR